MWHQDQARGTAGGMSRPYYAVTAMVRGGHRAECSCGWWLDRDHEDVAWDWLRHHLKADHGVVPSMRSAKSEGFSSRVLKAALGSKSPAGEDAHPR